MKKEQIFWFSGIWTLAGTIPAAIFLVVTMRQDYLRPFMSPLVTLITVVPWIIVLIRNALDLIIHQKDDFNPFHKTEEVSPQKTKALTGKIPQKYLSGQPTGIVLGKAGRSWVRIPVSAGSDGQVVLVSAAMGSGKTTGIYDQTLLAFGLPGADTSSSYVILDCKPDIMPITADISDSRTLFVSPTIAAAHGWDALAGLTTASTDDQIIAVLDRIAIALIPEESYGASIWVDGARNAMNYPRASLNRPLDG